MPGSNENREATEVIAIGGETLPAATQLKPKHFDFLETVLDQLYLHQYRHISHVTLLRLAAWIGIAALVKLFECAYVESLSLTAVIKQMILISLLGAFIIGTLCVFSKCFTRLSHARMNTLRVCQFAVCLSLLDFLSPFALGMTSFFAGFEKVLFASQYVLILGLSYGILVGLVTFRQLRTATIVYFVGCLLLIPTVLLFESARHFVFKDNEVIVYSDFGGGSSRKLDSIDTLVDEAVEALE